MMPTRLQITVGVFLKNHAQGFDFEPGIHFGGFQLDASNLSRTAGIEQKRLRYCN